MKKKNASAIMYIIIFLTMFLAFAAFAIDGTIVFSSRVKLQNATEIAALAAAEKFNYSNTATTAGITTAVTNAAKSTFNLLKFGGLQTVNTEDTKFFKVNVDSDNKEVQVSAKLIAQPFFLAFFGVTGINVEAIASAKSENLDVKANYAGINWLTASAAYKSDILSKNPSMNDTAILLPLGDFGSASFDNGYINFQLIEKDNSVKKALSLGPGGFITIKLPNPIVDKQGYDLYIEEAGTIEGYMVFAGIDKKADNPYVQKDKPGDGILWINISCAGVNNESDANNYLGTYTIGTDNLGTQYRSFGSQYFDIGNSCIGDISMVKYLRIVDDNDESGFVTSDDSSYYKAMLYGESSTATAGADINGIQVLNHVKLIQPKISKPF